MSKEMKRRNDNMKNDKKCLSKVIAKLAYYSAKHSANSTCYAWFGQSKLPNKVKQLRKLKNNNIFLCGGCDEKNKSFL
jgi:cyclic lactone autoinducer peptide